MKDLKISLKSGSTLVRCETFSLHSVSIYIGDKIDDEGGIFRGWSAILSTTSARRLRKWLDDWLAEQSRLKS